MVVEEAVVITPQVELPARVDLEAGEVVVLLQAQGDQEALVE
jgi:hypothetical protein